MFDGSSIAGWKAINESDMLLMPDPATAVMDPFFAAPTMVDRLRRPRARPPASPIAAIRAASPRRPKPFVASSGIGDAVYFGPEAEFFVFDDVRFRADPYNTGFVARFGRTAVEFRHAL